jgi:TolA-binding protein
MNTCRIILAASVFLPLAASAAEPAKPADHAGGAGVTAVQKAESDSGFKRVLDEMWARLRTYGPRASTGDARSGVTVIAGVRGAESTGTQLKPYWKGDRTDDPTYVQEVSAYHQAQAHADAGSADKAAAAFEEFLKAYPKSAFKPSAQFALALAYGAAGDKLKGRAAVDSFLHDYPAHPLVADAKRLSELMK